MSFLLFLIGFGYLIFEEGLWTAVVGMLAGLGIDLLVVLVAGSPILGIFNGWGLLDDVLMIWLGARVGFVDKFLIGLLLDQTLHVSEELFQHLDHTNEENRQYARYLQRHDPGATYLFGDVTPKDIIELGLSGGVLQWRGSFGKLLDAGKEKFGGLVTPTSEVIEIGGA
jgi:hypothetical protein